MPVVTMPHPPLPPLGMNVPVDFVVHAFLLNHRRSNPPAGKSDSVKVSASLKVDGVQYPAAFRDMGDLADTGRWYVFNLRFTAIPVNADSRVSFSFLVMNSGHPDESKIRSGMAKATDYMVAAEVASLPATGWWGLFALGGTEIIKYIMGQITDLIAANCDGTVAADVYQLNGSDIVGGTWTSVRDYPGIDSPHGCGGNSDYQVSVYTQLSNGRPNKDTLRPGETLAPVGHLLSKGGDFTVTMQADGNLVLYDTRISGDALWSSRTNGRSVTNCVMQSDGNLVLYSGSTAVWASGTNGNPGAAAVIQDDGNFVIYGPARNPLWSSETNVVRYP